MLHYIARQPILETNEQTFAYELLYRAGEENFARIDDPEDAARCVLDHLLTLGIEELTCGRRVFLNCIQELLTRRFVKLLPTENIVLKIPKPTTPNQTSRKTAPNLKPAGTAWLSTTLFPTRTPF